ncbi:MULTISPECIES: YicC/YloC family endoribonuclease [unclassified Clostridium]|uniref:YicC/YloC family endoribonuclease n=1 Tax=unclassified Clostridium TaxID=2614128 RepID=UPI000E47C4D5|nr:MULTISPECIES: YicC/YloC family endoribonuclease [unclassified Clostridium]RHS85932.1 YicC family protein [Clostridium sp. AM42-4]RHV87062.1 YicC family protein [Clostridium sp. OF09-36]HBM46667.1 YicC family protein [Lachnoclostridium sp.]
MIKSMTGFGRCEIVTAEYKISVEIKAVNHRYLDLSIKLPKKFNYFEAGIRNLLKTYIQRGKVDVFINYEDYTEEKMCLKYNSSLAAEYMNCFKQMEEQFGIKNDITVSGLAHMPEVLVMDQVAEDENKIWQELSEAVEEAAKKFVDSRVQEGEKLKTDLLGKLDYMGSLVAFIEERSPVILTEYRQKLEDKVKELLGSTPLDEGRIATEVTIYADKICVDEEMVRLHSHIDATRKELEAGGSVGRKLDFIAQEMNREANTTLSKSSDLEICDKAIALKTEIEKVREQIQNIE